MKAQKFIYLGKRGTLGDSFFLGGGVGESDIKYLRKDAVVSTIKDYLTNWLDSYRIERLIDKIEEL